ncbi:replication protein A 70 kDa DNA-binding subunit C-like protein [Tanacetum coccineum]|uniref:Replication protein A 70 kDa DNA-binding subunit C-like protein n=1 Tax=Tanacetum coccineum TaxID=301880 RepID=A0ABQ4WSC4_9ASTR
MSTKATIGKSNAQNNKHVFGEAAGRKHPTSHVELGLEIEIVPDMSGAKTDVEKKGISAGILGIKPDLFLDQLRVDVTGTIIVMIFHVWDVSAVSGRYLMTNFAMKPNKEEYRVIKDDSFMLEFDGSTTFKRVSVKADGFVRYPFNMVDFDAIEPADNKYLIGQLLLLYNVAGYVSNVGRTNHLKSGSKNLNFHLANHSQSELRYEETSGRFWLRKKLNRLFAFSDKVYLSSTSSTVILDDAEIPTIKALKDANSGVKLKNPYTPIDLTWLVKGTIKNLLMWARNPKNNVHSFPTSLVWNIVTPSNALNKLFVFAVRHVPLYGNHRWCQDQDGMRVDFPMLRYRLELDVSDVTMQTVVVLIDEPATTLVGYSAGSLMDTKDESTDDHVGLPPAISNLIGITHVMEIKSQSYYDTLDALDGVETHRLSRPVHAPTVATPTKPSEPQRTKSLVIEDSDVEVSGDSSGYVRRNKADPISNSNKRKQLVTEVSSKDVSCNTPQDDNTNRHGKQQEKERGQEQAGKALVISLLTQSMNQPKLVPSLT